MTKRFGKWTVVSSLPEGGQAHTFLVTDDKRDEYFVLKRLKNLKRLSRFELEIRAYKELSHANLLKLEDFNLESDQPFLVTEYCAGGSLEKADLSGYSTVEKLSIFLQICRGVGYAHRHDPQVIHRDLKPANIFLKSGNFTPVVGDFGICHYKDGDRFTVVDEVVGSRWYTAPELAHGITDDEDIKPAADVYSLGKVLYRMLSGKIFDREVYRMPRFDLTKGETRPDYFFVYELLDEMIVEDQLKRLPNANEVASKVESIIRRINMNAHHLDMSVPQACTYCGNGTYKVIFDSALSDDSVQPLGINFSTRYGSWMVLRCDHCGNIQWFRPDFYDQHSAWKRK